MEKNTKPLVLVPTDFSRVADFAVDHATGIAKLQDCKVTLFHVITKETKAQLKKDGDETAAIHKKLKLMVDEVVALKGVECDYYTEEGSIFTSIASVAEKLKASFLVMGTHGKIGVQNFIGSYAWKVVTSSPVPVIVVQETGFNFGYKRILLNVDETMESVQKIKWAIYIAKIFNSTVHLVSFKEAVASINKKIQANSNLMKEVLEKNKVHYEETVVEKTGNTATTIEYCAKMVQADLILIVTNPDTLMANFLLSQWDEQILFNASRIPVMCVNPVQTHIIGSVFM